MHSHAGLHGRFHAISVQARLLEEPSRRLLRRKLPSLYLARAQQIPSSQFQSDNGELAFITKTPGPLGRVAKHPVRTVVRKGHFCWPSRPPPPELGPGRSAPTRSCSARPGPALPGLARNKINKAQ